MKVRGIRAVPTRTEGGLSASVVLAGPARVGKTTVGKLLSERLGIPFRSLESANWDYYRDAGFREEELKRRWVEGGYEAYYRYLKPFEVYALERGLSDHPSCIVELSASQSVYEDGSLLARATKALELHIVTLLLPSLDVDESVRILEARQRAKYGAVDLDEHFVRHRSNYDLAKLIVYGKGRAPEEVRDEVIARIDRSQRVVILIGPMGAGKTTVGRLVAESLRLPEGDLDSLRWTYYAEAGWDEAEERRIRDADGFSGVYRYWKRFDLHAIERVLKDHQEGVITFGAGHSVYENDDELTRAKELLAPHPNVMLLLPSPDAEESLRVLRERLRRTVGGVDLNRHLIAHPSNRDLAKITAYAEGKAPNEVCEEIYGRIRDLVTANQALFKFTSLNGASGK